MKSYPFYRQRDMTQCGVTCLKMVCRYYGKRISFDRLSELCPSTYAGVSLLALSNAARSLGMDAVASKACLFHLESKPLPCILFWNQNHFVVLYRVLCNGRYLVADPGKGLMTIGKEDFLSHWSTDVDTGEGVVLYLLPNEAFYNQEESIDDEISSLNILWRFARNYKYQLYCALSFMIFGCLAEMILPFMSQMVVDRGISNQDISLVFLILAGQFILAVSQALSAFVRQRVLLKVSQHVNIDMLSDFITKMFRLPMSFFEGRHIGDLLQRMSDHGNVQQYLSANALEVIPSVLSIVVFGSVLLFYHWLLFLVLFVFCLLYALWMYCFVPRRRLLDYERFERESVNTSKTYQLVSNIREIKLQGCEERRREEWKATQSELLSVIIRKLRLQQRQEGGQVLLNEVKSILISALTALLVIRNDMTLGMMISVQYIIGQLNYPIHQLMNCLYVWQDLRVSLERINDIRQQPEERDGVELSQINGICTGIRFEHLNFKYDINNLEYTLRDISFEVPYGKVTAIVGASGSGKSTLLKLMLGYYSIRDGNLTVLGIPINDIDVHSWRSHCGTVMQESVLFSDTIEQNIVMSSYFSRERLETSSRAACIFDFIKGLPLGFKTKVGVDGLPLSEGQKQRILLARVIYKSPEYVFLDEATNSLDTISEANIVANLQEFYHGKTVVIVAHRLSTVRNADQIIVLDKGRVVETGSHDCLVRERGCYYHLVKNQLDLGV